MHIKDHEVPIEKLRWHCDPNFFKFECTRDLAPLHEFIGQERAIRAIDFGLKIANGGYNIYVAGLTGTGKTSIVKYYIEKLIKERETRGEVFKIEDWCYVYNFQEPDAPRIVDLPRGDGRQFRDSISQLLDRIKDELGKGNDLMVSGFGKWTVKSKKKRKGRNPKTGADLTIDARTVVTFKPSNVLRNAVNSED